MLSTIYISPEEGGGKGGGGPEDPGRSGSVLIRTSLLSVAFGIALGITFMIFFIIFKYLGVGVPGGPIKSLVVDINPSLWLCFLYGFVGGTIMAAIYNMLVVHRLNLFGLENYSD